jgi:membrane protease subunit HflC
MMRLGAPIFAAVVALVLVLTQTLFTVDERQHAIVFQLGEIVEVVRNPGLHVKLPFVQNVRYYDKRILILDSPEPERITTSEKKNVLVDSYVKWQIDDVKQYYISVAGDEEQAKRRLSQTVNSLLREEFGRRTIHDVVSGERDQVMEGTRKNADQDARKIGVRIVDVRVRRVDLPQEVSESVYRRMEAERKRVANELRSLGAAESERIRADADKQSEIIRADAYKQAQDTKGKGDAKSSAIYAAAYGQNAEFYAFYRSLEAYKQSFRSKGDVLVLEPSSEFFKYMRSAGSGKVAK